MFIKYSENNINNLEDGKRYICASKYPSWMGIDDDFWYSMLPYYANSESIGDDEFIGAGFYDYKDEYGHIRMDVVAYQEVEKFIEN